MKRVLISFLVFLFIHPALKAQETGEDKLGSWMMVFATHKVSNKLSIHSEIQYRTYEFFKNFNQLLLRAGLNYHFSENASATFGYGYIPTDGTFLKIENEKNTIENRIYEQFMVQNNLGKFKLNHPYRLEHRFIDSPISGKDTQHRFRYSLRVTYPIDEKWFLTAYDEIFLNLQEPTFGQNRLYGALGNHISKNVSVQAGYMNNYYMGTHFDRFLLGVWFNTDLRKKKN